MQHLQQQCGQSSITTFRIHWMPSLIWIKATSRMRSSLDALEVVRHAWLEIHHLHQPLQELWILRALKTLSLPSPCLGSSLHLCQGAAHQQTSLQRPHLQMTNLHLFQRSYIPGRSLRATSSPKLSPKCLRSWAEFLQQHHFPQLQQHHLYLWQQNQSCPLVRRIQVVLTLWYPSFMLWMSGQGTGRQLLPDMNTERWCLDVTEEICSQGVCIVSEIMFNISEASDDGQWTNLEQENKNPSMG